MSEKNDKQVEINKEILKCGKDCIGGDFDGTDLTVGPDKTIQPDVTGMYNLVMGMNNNYRRSYE